MSMHTCASLSTASAPLARRTQALEFTSGDAAHALLLQHQPGVLQEREQIRALLRQVRLWIEHHEPSSPVAILIKQADRMWGKRFSEVATMIPPDLMKAWDSDD